MEKRMLRKRHLLIIFMIVVISVYLNTVHSEQKPSSRSITALINKNRMEQTQNVTAYNIVNYSGTIFYKNKVAVLTYHHLDPVESSVTITPERFESQLKALKKNGFRRK